MTVKTNVAGGQATGTVVSVANTGGASGSACSEYLFVGTGTWKFDDTVMIDGKKTYKYDIPVTTDRARLRWNLGAGSASMSIEYYLKVPTNPTFAADIFSYLDTAFSGACHIGFGTGGNAGKLYIKNKAGVITYTSGALTANTVYRLESYCTVATATTGEAHLKVFAGNSTTAAYTVDVTASDMGTTNLQYIQFGQNANAGAAWSYYITGIWADNTQAAYLGLPVANSAPVVGAHVGGDVRVMNGATYNISMTGVDTGDTITDGQLKYRDYDAGGSYTNITTTKANMNTDTATVSNAAWSPPGIGVWQVAADLTDGELTGTNTFLVHVYGAPGESVPVRFSTGAFSNAGSTPAATKKAALNDLSDLSWLETAEAPSAVVETMTYYPHGPGDITLYARLRASIASPTVPTQLRPYEPDGTTALQAAQTETPTTTATDFPVIFDAGALAAASDTDRNALILKVTAG